MTNTPARDPIDVYALSFGHYVPSVVMCTIILAASLTAELFDVYFELLYVKMAIDSDTSHFYSILASCNRGCKLTQAMSGVIIIKFIA